MNLYKASAYSLMANKYWKTICFGIDIQRQNESNNGRIFFSKSNQTVKNPTTSIVKTLFDKYHKIFYIWPLFDIKYVWIICFNNNSAL